MSARVVLEFASFLAIRQTALSVWGVVAMGRPDRGLGAILPELYCCTKRLTVLSGSWNCFEIST